MKCCEEYAALLDPFVDGELTPEEMERVREHRSLRAAASSMEMAYSKAWTILREAEQGLGFKLLHTTTGGKNGGGAALTAEGARMLEAYERFEAELKAEAETLFLAHFHDFAGD